MVIAKTLFNMEEKFNVFHMDNFIYDSRIFNAMTYIHTMSVVFKRHVRKYEGISLSCEKSLSIDV